MNLLRSVLAFFLVVTFAFPASAATLYTYTPATPQSQSNWYSPDWKYRIKVTVDHEQVGEEVTDFPMVVKITNNQKLFKNAKQDGKDIVFTSSDGITKLDHELEAYNADNQELVAWVKIPKLSVTENTEIYAYYGNLTAEDQQRPTNVWGNGYTGVWHLNQDPAGQTKDSTKKETTGPSSGNMNANDSLQEGRVGKGLSFDGTNDYVNTNEFSNFRTNDFSVSSWIKTTSTAIKVGVAKSNGGPSAYWIGVGFGGAGRCVFAIPLLTLNPNSVCNDGQWHLLTATRQNNTVRLYKDGALIASGIDASDVAPGGNIVIGAYGITNTFFWSGNIDNVNVSSVARSGGWIKTEHNNQSDPESFYILSAEQTHTSSTTSNTSFTTPVYPYTTLTSFTERATKNTGTILYQLSPDNGKTWYYRKNNHEWIKATKEINANPAWAINTGIAYLPKGTGQLKIRAYLKPKNAKPVSLEQLQVGYTK